MKTYGWVLIVGMICLTVFGLFYFFIPVIRIPGTNNSYPLSIFFNTTTNQVTGNEVVVLKPDLRNVFLTYLLANPNLPDDCNACGGEWYWRADYIGCHGCDNPVINCNHVAPVYAMQLCQSINALGVCNAYTATCNY